MVTEKIKKKGDKRRSTRGPIHSYRQLAISSTLDIGQHSAIGYLHGRRFLSQGRALVYDESDTTSEGTKEKEAERRLERRKEVAASTIDYHEGKDTRGGTAAARLP